MMPFSVLRMWSLGMVGWALLGLGFYFIYLWANSAPAEVTQSAVITEPSPETERREVASVTVRSKSRDPIPLSVGVLLIVLGTCGGAPVIWTLRQFSAKGPHSFPARKSQIIVRPDGSKLHVEHHGLTSGPTLIFTHGWSLDRTEWYYARLALQDRFHLVFWDLAGLGRSGRPRNHDYSIEKMAADLQAVIGEAADGPVILIGHSIGGMIIQTFCRIFPNALTHRVIGLVLLHTTYTNPVKTTMLGKWFSALQKPLLEPLNYLTLWLSPLVWISNWQSYLNGSLHLSTRLTSYAGTQTWNQIDYSSRLLAFASPAVLARGNFAMSKFDAQATLPEISVPVLVIAGKNDRLTCDEASKFIQASIPNAELSELSPAGHLGHWERREECYQTLGDFCDRVSKSPSPNLPVSNDRSLIKKNAPAKVAT